MPAPPVRRSLLPGMLAALSLAGAAGAAVTQTAGAAVTQTAGAVPPPSLASAAIRNPTPPVVRERFTPLPCTGKPRARSTLQQEGCAEHSILTTDAQINALARSIFAALPDASARRRFVAAAQAWIAYRRADCLSASDVFQGGTEAPVLDAQCGVERNRQRITDLRAFLTALRLTG